LRSVLIPAAKAGAQVGTARATMFPLRTLRGLASLKDATVPSSGPRFSTGVFRRRRNFSSPATLSFFRTVTAAWGGPPNRSLSFARSLDVGFPR